MATCSLFKKIKNRSKTTTNAHNMLVKRRQGRTATPFLCVLGHVRESMRNQEAAGGRRKRTVRPCRLLARSCVHR
jgi:hypothetical protein